MDYLSLFSACWFWGFHYIFDFIFQTSWQAENKSKNEHALSNHCWVYSLSMMVVTFVYFNLFSEIHWGLLESVGTLMFFYSAHFVTDFFTSKKTARHFRRKNYHMGFVIVGLDQFIHFLTIMVPIYILMS